MADKEDKKAAGADRATVAAEPRQRAGTVAHTGAMTHMRNADGSETEAGKLAAEKADVGEVSKNDGQVDASGAIQEAGALTAEELAHPAVDSNPRADTTALQNHADFNNPTLTDSAAVKENLGLEDAEPLEVRQATVRMVDGTAEDRRASRR